MLTQSFRSSLITLLLFIVAGLLIATSSWLVGAQATGSTRLAEIGNPSAPAVATR